MGDPHHILQDTNSGAEDSLWGWGWGSLQPMVRKAQRAGYGIREDLSDRKGSGQHKVPLGAV